MISVSRLPFSKWHFLLVYLIMFLEDKNNFPIFESHSLVSEMDVLCSRHPLHKEA